QGPDRFVVTEYERESIRPRLLGKFRDLLGATARSPAMLFYLDNWLRADPNGPHAAPRALPHLQAQGRRAPKGLNENYGRELMELHTLGVDGGYTQNDVTEVARAFTGWTIENPRQGGGFKFEPRIHDAGEKIVLGHVIKAGGGESDGEQVLDILAAHPSTARFISTKLARRFVGDTPPTGYKDTADAWVNTGALVNRMNFAMRLAGSRLPRIAGVSPSALDTLDSQAVIERLLGGDASDTTRATIAKATTAPQMTALTLGAPEFQRR